MPTIISHAVMAVSASAGLAPSGAGRRFWIWAIVLAMLPDADVIGFSLGIDYHHVLGHRGFFHSPFFALLASGAVMLICFRDLGRFSKPWWGCFCLLALIGASHGIMDAMTNGGLGIAFFSPFDNTRYFLPWQPIVVSPLGIRRFFSPWGLQVIISELVWIWLPCAGFVIGARLIRWGLARARKAQIKAHAHPEK